MDSDGLAFALLRHGPGGESQLEICEFHPVESPEELPQTLASLVSEHGLRGTPCVAVLSPGSYAMRLLEAPEVPANELRSAVRWGMQETIDFDVEHAVVDLFEIPGGERRRGGRAIYAVAAREQAAREVVAAVVNSGLQLAALDIAELALRNLGSLHPADADGVAILALRQDAGLVTVQRNAGVYVARWIDSAHEMLADVEEKLADELASPLGNEDVDTLVLDLQRSIDYYQHELAQRPIDRILVAPVPGGSSELCALLSRDLGIPAEPLDLDALLACSAPVAADVQFRSLLAAGACLRRHREQQVDLFDASLRVRRAPLSPAVIGQTLLGFAALLIVSTVWLMSTSWMEDRTLIQLESEAQHWTQRVASLEEQLQKHDDPSQLAGQIDRLESDLGKRRRLLQLLGSSEGSGPSGFSGHLLGLSRQRVEGLWLTGIEIRDGGRSFILQGGALRSELVPQMLQHLGREDAFRGAEFRTFTLERSGARAGVVEFDVRSATEEDGA
jgi:MSHA biogenesis protein MshI